MTKEWHVKIFIMRTSESSKLYCFFEIAFTCKVELDRALPWPENIYDLSWFENGFHET